ncbi:protein of unknown function [Mucilaginibacter lappiensis]|uniref:DUF3857 domain-containing protein n=1 Tax=Mucilaginibacter lappiensis TaxID=354630 RepID=A0ABR6PKM4_9SPHI|nr:DUF3857 domain-containing protein [Mucilaginibacter lappiensis]MBB6110322.1 hypothetical protein [Mucilaginibacter lappiensis]SIR30362.1 protein of unknown function [Mucilaginibacter lappiensis]
MNKIFTLLLLGCMAVAANAQTPAPVPTAQAFGKADKADLELKACDFEKDANAEILFDKAEVYFDQTYNIVTERHKRIKIFNDNGKSEANIRIEYYSANRSEYISGLQAQTINAANGTPEIVKVDKKQIFTEVIDKYRSAMVFSFPNVKPGSILEYKYRLTSASITDFPDWYFQSDLPTRYSELSTNVPDILFYKQLVNVHSPYVVDKTNSSNAHIQALANIPSLKDEPFMGSRSDNSERILFQLLSIKPTNGFTQTYQDSWKKVGENKADDEDFGGQINRKLTGEEAIIAKAKGLKTDDNKISYLFNEVKNTVKWNDSYARYTNDGTVKAWDKKIGNSTEINLILTHLLKKSGVKVYPMLVSTRSNGRVNPAYPSFYQFNTTVAYIPVDSNKYYVLDATNKYNIYNQVPNNYLNSFGLYINKDDQVYDLAFLDDKDPVRQIVLINAEIKPEGKMSGTADISSFAYNRVNCIKKYKTDGEKKYIDFLRNDNNNMKIASVKFENMEVDTLPLQQKMDFNLDLPGADENYIYFNSNLFTNLKTNPFLNENRVTDIDFGYRDNYAITGIFKLPAGYKVDALPKSISMMIPDKSIIFRRIVAEQDGSIMIRLNVDFKQSMYFKENYPEFHEFCKKMYEMLNEQVVLKKS